MTVCAMKVKDRPMVKFLFAGCLLLLSACHAKPGASGAAVPVQSDTATYARQFPFPELPATLTGPEERRAWLLTHYWERFDFSDTLLVNDRTVTEQGFADFIALLADGTPAATVRESLGNWCARFLPEPRAREVLTQAADDYLFNPNSPFYNERLYGWYLEALLEQLPEGDAQRSTCRFKLGLLMRNNVGDQATDFTYYLPDGHRCTLLGTTVRGEYLLLSFYDPECPTCHDVLMQMATDRALASAVACGTLTVLAIYTEGNEEVWQRTLGDLPDGWQAGNDRQQVKDRALYDLKAMPSLYLLDREKNVLLKDASYEAIRKRLGL